MSVILNAVISSNALPKPLVTGGTLYSDDTYYYRAFTNVGTSTLGVSVAPLTADILVVAGGGGGGVSATGTLGGNGGGGGAGGVQVFSNQSISSNTSIIVGYGGSNSGVLATGKGGNSQFGNLSPSLGGGIGWCWFTGVSASSGGSGGGAWGGSGSYTTPSYGAAGTLGQGFAGGNADWNGNNYNETSGGGGGAGGPGGNGIGGTSVAISSVMGNGGIGTALYNSWLVACSIGQNIGGVWYIGGGGGGGATGGAQLSSTPGIGGYGGGGNGASRTSNASSGIPNTGGGGGGAGFSGSNTTTFSAGSGGSGVVIVRYTKAQM